MDSSPPTGQRIQVLFTRCVNETFPGAGAMMQVRGPMGRFSLVDGRFEAELDHGPFRVAIWPEFPATYLTL